MVRYSLAILCGLVLLLVARGQDGDTGVGEMVRDLGDASFQVRKEARAKLAALGWEAKAELEEAAKNPDPEVADVARALLGEMLPGVTRQTPEAQRKLVAAYVSAPNAGVVRSCARELLGQRPVPYDLLLALIEWEQEPGRKRALFGAALGVVETLHYELLESAKEGVYDRFLQWGVRLEALGSIPYIAAYAFRRGKLDEMREQMKAVVAANPTRFSRRLLVELHLLAGATDEAVAVARAEQRPETAYLQDVLVRGCRWQELAESLVETMGDAKGWRRFQLAAAQRLAGQEKQALETLRGLPGGETAKGGDEGDGQAVGEQAFIDLNGVGNMHLFAGDMFFAQQVDLGMIAMPQVEGMNMRFRGRRGMSERKVPSWRFLLAYGLIEDALQASGRDKAGAAEASSIAWQLHRYVDADRLLKQMAEGLEPPANWLCALRRAGFLRELGDESAAVVAKEMLERCRVGDKELAQTNVFVSVLRMVSASGFETALREALPELMSHFEGQDRKQARQWASSLVPPATNQVALAWWDLMDKHDPDEGLAERAKRLQQFLSGRLPDAESDAILRLALNPEGRAKDRVDGLLLTARTCALLERQKEAVAAYRLAARYATESGDQVLMRRTYVAAQSVFAPVLDWRELAAGAGGLVELGAPAWCAVTQGTYLSFAGDDERARTLVDRAVRATAGKPLMSTVAKPLLDGGWTDDLRRVLPLVEMQSPLSLGEPLEAARAVGDYELELRLTQRVWYAFVCSPADVKTTDLVSANAALLGAECRALIGKRSPAEVLGQAQEVSDAFPDDIDGVADTVEAFDRAGLKAEGDQLVAHVLEREMAVLDKLPNAVQHLNSVAWLCARTGRQLARGEECSLKSIERAPDRDAFIDTLAVIRYRQGDLEGAVKAGRECLRIAPDDSHHLYQLGKWLRESRKQSGANAVHP